VSAHLDAPHHRIPLHNGGGPVPADQWSAQTEQ
jgi:hypothetical protein